MLMKRLFYHISKSERVISMGSVDAMIFNDTAEVFGNMVPIAIFALIVFVLGVSLTSWKQD